MKLLIIGHGRHGKDTIAAMITNHIGLTKTNSSQYACDTFIYEELKGKYGYKNSEECFKDRYNHRKEWYNLIADYCKEDPSRLAKSILEKVDMYIGMRAKDQIEDALSLKLFDYIVGVYDPRKPLEGDSFGFNLFDYADFVIPNSGTLEDLEKRVLKVIKPIIIRRYLSGRIIHPETYQK